VVLQSAIAESGCIQDSEKFLDRLTNGINPQFRIRLLGGAVDKSGKPLPGIIPMLLFTGRVDMKKIQQTAGESQFAATCRDLCGFQAAGRGKTGGCGSGKT
jgi:hypothetical protein